MIGWRFDFEGMLEGAKFNKLNLKNCGSQYLSNFSQDPNRLRYLLTALGEYDDVRNSLKTFAIDSTKLKKREIEQMLREANLK